MGGGRGRRERRGGGPLSPAGAGAAAADAWDRPWPLLARLSASAPWSSSACTARSCRCGRTEEKLDSAGEQRRRRLAHLEQRRRRWVGGRRRNVDLDRELAGMSEGNRVTDNSREIGLGWASWCVGSASSDGSDRFYGDDPRRGHSCDLTGWRRLDSRMS
jgi:hypothetical protein